MTGVARPTDVVQCDAHEAPQEVTEEFLEVVNGDVATFTARYLATYGSVPGLWIVLREGYQPSLIARDIATLTHLGHLEKVAIEGDNANDALVVIAALLTGESVTMDSPFGNLREAFNRPRPVHPVALFVAERRNGQRWVAPFVGDESA